MRLEACANSKAVARTGSGMGHSSFDRHCTRGIYSSGAAEADFWHSAPADVDAVQ